MFPPLSLSSSTQLLQVKILNKLASARTSGLGHGSKVLTDMIDGLQEAAVSVELRLKINQDHPDLKERWVTAFYFFVICHLPALKKLVTEKKKKQKYPGHSANTERWC